jgi:hypothetical protein
MPFDFFSFRKKPVIEDVEVKISTPIQESGLQNQTESSSEPSTEPLSSFEPDKILEQTAPPEASVAEVMAGAVPLIPSPVIAAPEPEARREGMGQMDTLKATREDVIAAYKIFLGRLPESMEVVDPRVGVSPNALLADFLASKEFLDQTPKAQFVLAVSKKILDARKTPVSTGPQAS